MIFKGNKHEVGLLPVARYWYSKRDCSFELYNQAQIQNIKFHPTSTRGTTILTYIAIIVASPIHHFSFNSPRYLEKKLPNRVHNPSSYIVEDLPVIKPNSTTNVSRYPVAFRGSIQNRAIRIEQDRIPRITADARVRRGTGAFSSRRWQHFYARVPRWRGR